MDCTLSAAGHAWRRLSRQEIAALLPHVADLARDQEAALSIMARMLGAAPPLDDATADALVREAARQIRADADALLYLATVVPAGNA